MCVFVCFYMCVRAFMHVCNSFTCVFMVLLCAHGVQVRTKDDALITVKLMNFFELRHIKTMLNQTSDPVADFIKSVHS